LINQLKTVLQQKDLAYILGDMPCIIKESKKGLDRIRYIVTNLKQFAHKNDEQKTAPLSVNKSIEAAISIAWNEIKYTAELQKELAEVPQILGDQQQLSQVFINLLINAVHALKGRGTIIVRSYVKENWVCVDIEDNGTGIPTNIMDHIFEPFFTTKEVGKGTGLGLSISYEIIKHHGGKIDVDSVEGKGTTFTVCLPLTPA
jgi:two-component system NtrC family sensor kinase